MGDGFRGFDIVRRGYDRGEVDAYLLLLAAGADPGGVPVFTLVRRGYDPAQVEARVAELRGEAR